MSEWKPEYLCVLDSGCRNSGHSLNFKDRNRAYAEAARLQERKRRIARMNSVIRGGTPE